jgi:hypothetical protein
VDIEAWGGHPSFRVRGNNFVFCDAAESNSYGLGQHGCVSLTEGPDASDERWRQITECVRTSFALVAPRSLARLVPADTGLQ